MSGKSLRLAEDTVCSLSGNFFLQQQKFHFLYHNQILDWHKDYESAILLHELILSECKLVEGVLNLLLPFNFEPQLILH